jgi:hypothetical protein
VRAAILTTHTSTIFQIEGTDATSRRASITSSTSDDAGGALILAKQKSGSIGGNTIVQNNDSFGVISFQGSDGSEFVAGAVIQGLVDGTPGANDMPGRLVFSTTADGASSPTERMRITNGGALLVNTTSLIDPATGSADGFSVNSDGFVGLSMNNNSPLNIRRRNSGWHNRWMLGETRTLVGTISVTAPPPPPITPPPTTA